MTVHRFADEFELVAPLYGRSPAELRANDAGNDRFRGRWFALVEDQVVATATAWTRPDERMFLSFVGDGAA